MANIKDVARVAGVGLGTVSRYLNGYTVTDSNKQKIEKSISELNYVVNPIARSMITKKSMTVAVVVPRLANIFSMKIIESIENHLESCGYSIIVSDCSENAEKEIRQLKAACEKMVDGIVLISSNTNAENIRNTVKDIPLVLVDRVLDNNVFDSVIVENRLSSYKAVNECIHSGSKRIVVLAGPANISTAAQRLNGVLDAFSENDIECPENMIHRCSFDTNEGYNIIKNVLNEDKPDAIFACNYELTIGAIKALNEAKLILGKDIELIGFDNLDLVNVYPYSMLVISQPMEQIGLSAAKLLHERMQNNSIEQQNIVLKNEIIKT